jgi:catechol 2,3-dioxygenase-like lactoylglutathione lyase family enzyme
MIKRLSHTTIWVLDQERALAFYTQKLGFEVRTDAKMGDFRWLTLGVPGQPDLEVVLMKVEPSPMMEAAMADKLRDLVRAGKLGAGVLAVDDCQKTYEELKAKGVEFLQAPEERPYGIEALLKDDSGNWFSMTQRRT